MPPKAKVTRTDILNAALAIVRERGEGALNARELAARLGVSTQPVFSNYATMDALRQDVIAAAHEEYRALLTQCMDSGRYPIYKASGMGYIKFAKEEKELFKLLFMRDRSGEQVTEDRAEIEPLIALIRRNTGMSEEAAYRFHLEMWVCVHGLATMIATSYLDWDLETISGMLTDCYMGLKTRFCGEETTEWTQ